jgi:opacity protein-like surface antigen
MLRKPFCLVLSLFAMGAAGSSAAAQARSSRPVQLVVSGGLTLPAGDLKDFHDTGFHYDASLLVSFAGIPLTLRPEVSLTRFKLKTSQLGYSSGPGYSSGDVTQMVGALGNIEVPLAGGLYVLAGGGLLQLKTPDGSTSTSSSDISQSKITFDAGAGLRFKLGGISGFLEGRIGSASYDQGKFGYSKAQYIPFTFGLVF